MAVTQASRGQTFRALRHRNARVYFAGLLVSNIGTWLQLTAMSLLVYDLTGRSTDLGITVALPHASYQDFVDRLA